MLRDRGRVALVVLQHPLARGVRVVHRLERREGLGRDEEERLLRVHVADGLGEVRGVDVGDEPEAQIALRERREGDRGHAGPEVGAADADVDDVADGLAAQTPPRAGADLVGEGGHLVEDLADAGHDVLAVALVDHGAAGEGAQRDVQDRAVLRLVDVLAAEHRLDLLLKAALAGERVEVGHRPVVDEVLGEVERPAGGPDRHLAGAVGVRGEGGAEGEMRVGFVVALERGPGGGFREHGCVLRGRG